MSILNLHPVLQIMRLFLISDPHQPHMKQFLISNLQEIIFCNITYLICFKMVPNFLSFTWSELIALPSKPCTLANFRFNGKLLVGRNFSQLFSVQFSVVLSRFVCYSILANWLILNLMNQMNFKINITFVYMIMTK